MSFVRLGADALMESLVKFNYRAHGVPAASDRIRTESFLFSLLKGSESLRSDMREPLLKFSVRQCVVLE